MPEVCYHPSRNHRIMVRLSDAEIGYIEEVREKAGLLNRSEALRFIINMSRLQTEGRVAIYPDPRAFIEWLEREGLIRRVNRGENRE